MKPLALTVLAIALLSAAPAKPKFTGVITDSMCARGDHSAMRMGPTAADCTVACVLAHDAMYVLFDGKQAYTLSDQQTPETFAGKKVTITGTLDIKTKILNVDAIVPAK